MTTKFRSPNDRSSERLGIAGSRSAQTHIRQKGVVRYMGWAVPEAVYIDYDVLRSAPPHFNWSGIGDILCNHTGVLDWRYATERGFCEAK